MNMIASDAQNPEFTGAHDPDRRLTVQFYSSAEQNNFESEKAGRPIFYDVDKVRIYVPGDKNNVIDTFVRDDHKKRFPLQWAHFQNQREGDQRLAGKTPLSAWPRLTPAQSEELRALRFYGVEDVANASDNQLQAIGMIAGMAPYAFRDAAKRFLALAEGDAKAAEADKRLADMQATHQAEMAAMRAEMQERFAKMAAPELPLADDQKPEPKKAAK